MRRKLFVVLMLAIPLVTMARQVVIETRSLSLVINADEGHQPQFVYFGQKLSAADLNALNAQPSTLNANGRMDLYPPYGMWPQSAAAMSLRHADGNLTTQLFTTNVEQQGDVTCITLKDRHYQR